MQTSFLLPACSLSVCSKFKEDHMPCVLMSCSTIRTHFNYIQWGLTQLTNVRLLQNVYVDAITQIIYASLWGIARWVLKFQLFKSCISLSNKSPSVRCEPNNK